MSGISIYPLDLSYNTKSIIKTLTEDLISATLSSEGGPAKFSERVKQAEMGYILTNANLTMLHCRDGVIKSISSSEFISNPWLSC